jgi:uncharacterized protein (TIGR02266 family)
MEIPVTRRQHPRVPLRQPIEFAVTTPFEGAVMKTISQGGLCIVTSTPPLVGTRLLVRFTIPGDSEPMNAVGVTVWTRLVRPQKAEVGLKFIGLREDNQVRFQKYCAEHGTV